MPPPNVLPGHLRYMSVRLGHEKHNSCFASDLSKVFPLPLAERVGCGTPCLLGSLGGREVVGSRPGRGNSKESFSSYQETGKVFSPEMPFYSKFGNK